MKVLSKRTNKRGSTTYILSDGTNHNIFYTTQMTVTDQAKCTFVFGTDEYEAVLDAVLISMGISPEGAE